MLQRAGTRYRAIALDGLDEYRRSRRKLIAAGAKRSFPGHGAPFSVKRWSRTLLGAARTHARRR